jgi:hypothetical protein
VDDQLQVTQPAAQAIFYPVKRGDTRSNIAQAHYGDATQYAQIYEANRRCSWTLTRCTRGRRCAFPNEYRLGVAGLSLREKRGTHMADDLTGVRRRYLLAAWLIGAGLGSVLTRCTRR